MFDHWNLWFGIYLKFGACYLRRTPFQQRRFIPFRKEVLCPEKKWVKWNTSVKR